MGITMEEQEDGHHCQTMQEFNISLEQHFTDLKENVVHSVSITHKDIKWPSMYNQ